MKTTHIGKIGRLPRNLRNELGARIENGQEGQTILNWLNGQPETQAMLKQHFEGRSITAQNLSEWRATGHREWVDQQEAIAYVNQLCEQGRAMDGSEFAECLSDRLAAVLAGELMRTAAELGAKTVDAEERWKQLCALNRELERLRKQDHRAEELRLKREAKAVMSDEGRVMRGGRDGSMGDGSTEAGKSELIQPNTRTSTTALNTEVDDRQQMGASKSKLIQPMEKGSRFQVSDGMQSGKGESNLIQAN